MPSPPIRTVVVGYGLAGRVFHCPFVSAVPGLALSTIVQRRGDEAAAAYPHVRILRSPEEAFADPELDLVIVATPNQTHVELAAAALRAGKHVVVDKPFCGNEAEGRGLAELAAAQGRQLIPFHNRRWDADFLTLRKLLDEGSLGRVVEVRSRWDRYRPLQKPNTWKEAQGPLHGILFDLGPHLVDQAVALFGVPARLTASVRKDRDRTEINDAFDLTLEYEREGHALRYHCSATMLGAESAPRFIVHGTAGSYVKCGLDLQEPALIAAARTASGLRPPTVGDMLPGGEPWLAEPASAWGTLTLAKRQTDPIELAREPYPSVAGDYRLFYAGVRDAVLGRGQPPVTAKDGVCVARLLDLALAASREGCTLPVTL